MRAAMLLPAVLPLLFGIARADDPDPVELARKSVDAEKANRVRARQYAFREYKVTRHLDHNGKETGRESRTWDVIGLEGSTYRKLTMIDDKPLPPKEQKHEDERLKKETELRKKETLEQRRNRTISLSYSYFFPYNKIVEIYDFRYLGEELVEGKRTWIIEGTPKADFHPTSDDQKESLNYKVKLWLVQEDYCYARLELDVIGDHSRMQKGSHVRQDSARKDDGVWLPTVLTFKYSARFFKMISARGEMTTAYSDYHKFQVDSRMVEITEKQ